MQNPVIDQFGTKKWYNDKGQLHNENGPAVMYSDGAQFWRVNGEAHRTDGPAVINPDGSQHWYINNKKYYNNRSYQKAAGITDEDMLAITLKYGNIS